MLDISSCIKSISMDGTLSQEPVYSVKEASQLVGMSSHTLRYYDKLNLFPFTKRSSGNARLFSDADLEWIRLVECLRNTGMSLSEIQHYVSLCLQGNSTIDERIQIIAKQEEALTLQLEEMKHNLKLLQFKKNFYMSLSQNKSEKDLLNPLNRAKQEQ